MQNRQLPAASKARTRNILTILIACSFATVCLALALRGLL
jgi:hypothetical protein